MTADRHARILEGARDAAAPLEVPASVRLTLPARAENVGVVRQVLDAVLGEMDPGLLDDVRLAVTEACTNVVRHAYRELPEGPMEVVARRRPDRLEVVVSDFGHGLGPTHAASGPGLGLPLIGARAARLDVEYAAGAGTRLAMTFALEPAERRAPTA